MCVAVGRNFGHAAERFQVDQAFEPPEGGLSEFLGQAAAAVARPSCSRVRGRGCRTREGRRGRVWGAEEAGVTDFLAFGDAVLTGLDLPEVDGRLADGGEAFEAGLAGDGREGDEFG